MKKLAYNLFTLIALLACSAEIQAVGKCDYEKKKQISKSYTVNPNVKLDINNKFGKVHINTWEKNFMTIEIEIVVRMRSEDRAKNVLNKISVDIDESSTVKAFRTKIDGNLKNKNCEEFEINYEVYMPKKNPLKLKNSFGSTYIGDYLGVSEINISYGDIRIGNLGGKTDMKISFSDGSVRSVNSGEIVIKYSKINFENLETVRLEQGFSEIEIRNAGALNLTSKYGEVEIGTVQGIKGYVGYSDFSIERLEMEIDMNASYSGGFTIDEVAKGFSKLILDGEFGDFGISFEEGVNFSFDNNLKFGDFSYSGMQLDFHYRVTESFKSIYRGTYGTGKGGRVKINSSYGDIRFR